MKETTESGPAGVIASSALELLPNELLTIIANLVYLPRKNYYHHLDQSCLGTRDLLSLMRCSRRLLNVGQPILWTRLVQSNPRVLLYFIRMALARLDLANQVRRAELTEQGIQLKNYDPLNDIDAKTLENIKSYVLYKHKDPDEKPFKYGLWITLATFALSLTPNVEELEIEPLWTDVPDHLSHLEGAFARNIPVVGGEELVFLPKLQTLSFSFTRRSRCPGLQSLVSFMQHPSLEVFVGRKILGVEPLWAEGTTRPSILLRKIYFEKSNISTAVFTDLLACCPALESLTYDHDQNRRHIDVDFQPAQFGAAIARLKPTLKELAVFRRERLHETFNSTAAVNLTTIGPLSQFSALTSISITAHLLLGHQRSHGSSWSRLFEELAPGNTQKLAGLLPKSIEKLRLMNCGGNILRDVTELVEAKDWLAPKLKSIVLEFQDLMYNKYDGGFLEKMVTRHSATHLMVDNKQLDTLEELCTKNGIELDVWYN